MIALFRIVLQLVTDLAGIVPLAVRRQGALAAETPMLRRQLALYVERGVKRRCIDPATVSVSHCCPDFSSGAMPWW